MDFLIIPFKSPFLLNLDLLKKNKMRETKKRAWISIGGVEINYVCNIFGICIGDYYLKFALKCVVQLNSKIIGLRL